MIFSQPAVLVVIRGYRTHVLKQRIDRHLKSIRRVHPRNTALDSPWSSVSNLPSLDSALAHLEFLAGPSAHPEDYDFPPPPLAAPPTWLLVQLCSKVRSPADAEKASHLIITYLPHNLSAQRPPLLILVVHMLSTYRVLPALDRVIKLFIGLPLFHEYWHFNRLLQALSLYMQSPTDARYMARLAILLLKTMTERELLLTNKTYSLLLRNRYVTTELAEELRQHMIRDKFVPGPVHLESLLRVSAHYGSLHDATASARAIHDLDQRPKRRGKAPHVTVPNQPGPTETDQIVPSNTVEYLTHLVHENSLRAQFNADAEWLQFLKTGHSHRFPNKQNTSAAAWAARLLSLSRTRSFSPENLVAFFEWSHAQGFPFRTHTTLSYTIVLRGLLRKRAYPLALEIWERYRRHGTRNLHLDHVALNVALEVLTRAGHPDRALALIDSLSDQCRARHASRRLSLAARKPTVPAPMITCFMRVLVATNPSAALRLWECMGILYNITPNADAFTAMLDAARKATLNGESFAGAMQELGFGFRFRLPFAKTAMGTQPEPADAQSLDGARHRSLAKFQSSLAVNEGDMWGGERAWRRAYRIFTSALLAGWPALADVRPPAHAVRASVESPATAPLRDLKRFLTPHNATDSDEGPTRSTPTPTLTLHADPAADLRAPHPPPPPLLPIHSRGAYPTFAPNDATFHAAVLLLGIARAAGEIPQTLAWMRALDIAPRTRTLAYALVFWAEVSIGAPLLEWIRGTRVGGGGGDGEYRRLVRWMEEWVGAQNVPDEAAVGEAMVRIEGMRRLHGQSGDRA